MVNKIITPDTPVLRIEPGHGRFTTAVDKKTGEGVIIFCCSDKCAPELGANVQLPEDETWLSVMGIGLTDHRQATAYSEAFHLLANQMKLEAGLN